MEEQDGFGRLAVVLTGRADRAWDELERTGEACRGQGWSELDRLRQAGLHDKEGRRGLDGSGNEGLGLSRTGKEWTGMADRVRSDRHGPIRFGVLGRHGRHDAEWQARVADEAEQGSA